MICTNNCLPKNLLTSDGIKMVTGSHMSSFPLYYHIPSFLTCSITTKVKRNVDYSDAPLINVNLLTVFTFWYCIPETDLISEEWLEVVRKGRSHWDLASGCHWHFDQTTGVPISGSEVKSPAAAASGENPGLSIFPVVLGPLSLLRNIPCHHPLTNHSRTLVLLLLGEIPTY